MRDKIITIAPAIIMLVVLWGIYTVRCYSRGRGVPTCWKCGARKVRRSHLSGFTDTLAAYAGLHPFRCKGCLTRFYGLRSRRNFAETS